MKQIFIDEEEEDMHTKQIMEEDMEMNDLCVNCDGTGEGMHDGSRCGYCKGKGTIANGYRSATYY